MKTRPKLTFASFFALLQATATSFGEDRVGRHAAALAYYTVFSISPLFLIVISIAALYFRDQAQAVGAIQSQIQDTIGPTAAKAVEQMIQGANNHGGDTSKPITATLVALGVALWGASGLFGALQDSLNSIWGVMPDPKLGFLSVARARFVSFGMVLGVGFLLLVSLILTTVLAAISKTMSGSLGDSIYIASTLNFALGLGVSMLLFGAIFKVLPDAKIQWRDVWVGAFVTALLFSLGRFALGKYLGRPQVASAYGSAGALVVLLLWVNYAATILFVGAEFTKAYANKFGSKIVPDDNAILLSPEARAKQGFSPQTTGAPVSGSSAKGAVLVAGEPLTPHKPAVSAEQKQAFEHSLSVISGAILVFLWIFRKRSREDD
ncbi:membrane protein [Abditibacterium utsteinense]|uniref:Membrane protein n=1 Tax=Abditibacterium utsteinense TaxID=1960156 RepID=A0A2S8SV66_9BACT|nr:YihY/virulence factor BrkB family protein [Abditibacterium utsteinense]PQV64695.1 membrane protein [Abditibacterium utsteinense]